MNKLVIQQLNQNISDLYKGTTNMNNSSQCISALNCTVESEGLYYNDTLLHKLSHERMMFNIPATTILCLIMVIGLIGNIFVIMTYNFFSPKTPANFYIVMLASLDLTSCLLGLPYHIYNLCWPYIYALPTVCRISRFFENFSNLGSGFVLVSVASERYFKIKFPLMAYGRTKAKKVTLVVLVLSVSLSWPHFLINQSSIIQIGKEQVTGEDCGYGNRNEPMVMVYVFIFQGVLLFVYVISFCGFVVFYGYILSVIVQRKREIKKNHIYISNKQCTDKAQPTENRFDRCFSVTGVKIRSSKTTICLLTVTITAMLSYTPFLLIMFLRSAGLYFQTTLTPSGEYFHYGTSAAIDLACTICIKSYFINSALNPIIYSVLNPAFRKRCRTGIKRISQRLSQRQEDK